MSRLELLKARVHAFGGTVIGHLWQGPFLFARVKCRMGHAAFMYPEDATQWCEQCEDDFEDASRKKKARLRGAQILRDVLRISRSGLTFDARHFWGYNDDLPVQCGGCLKKFAASPCRLRRQPYCPYC